MKARSIPRKYINSDSYFPEIYHPNHEKKAMLDWLAVRKEKLCYYQSAKQLLEQVKTMNYEEKSPKRVIKKCEMTFIDNVAYILQ